MISEYDHVTQIEIIYFKYSFMILITRTEVGYLIVINFLIISR